MCKIAESIRLLYAVGKERGDDSVARTTRAAHHHVEFPMQGLTRSLRQGLGQGIMACAIRRAMPASVLLMASIGAAACGDNASQRAGGAAADGAMTEISLEPSPAPASPATSRFASSGAPASVSQKLSGEFRADASAQPTIASPAMVIRSGSASVRVDSLELGIAALQKLATALGGYVGNSSLSAGDNQMRSATLDLRIPSARFDDALTGLDPLGKVESVVSTAEDVGEEFVDITARVANARRLEERLITLLATRTGKLEDVLAVERELSRVREEIERYEGRLRYLKSRVATSLMSVTIHEPAPLLGAAPGENVIVDAFKDAWRNFVHFVAWFISSLGVLIPVAALTVFSLWWWRRARRK